MLKSENGTFRTWGNKMPWSAIGCKAARPT